MQTSQVLITGCKKLSSREIQKNYEALYREYDCVQFAGIE